MIRRPPRSTLSLHDALPISAKSRAVHDPIETTYGKRVVTRACVLGTLRRLSLQKRPRAHEQSDQDRKSTRLNSSHANISYAVFCLKKKKTHYFLQQVHLYYT